MNKYEAGASNWKDEDIPDFMPEEGNYNVRSLIFKIRKNSSTYVSIIVSQVPKRRGPSVSDQMQPIAVPPRMERLQVIFHLPP